MIGKIIKTGFLISLCVLSVSCSKYYEKEKSDSSITDNEEFYQGDTLDGIKELYVTVLEPKQNEPRYDFTLSQLNANIIDPFAKDDPEVRVIFQEGVNGVIQKDNYGYGLTDYNATMKLRGQSARIADLKSYKIRLNSKAPWGKFVTINLNKHPFDDLRIRNKLAFELIKDVEHITSVST
ncbi:MAG: CotH kinase family protein, partial [Sphaerochaetaceae bacterium]|nr:CotH kinase family protein [Sphaerochaetaceae bacterium]